MHTPYVRGWGGQAPSRAKDREKTAESRREINAGAERPCGREQRRLWKHRRVRRFYTILELIVPGGPVPQKMLELVAEAD